MSPVDKIVLPLVVIAAISAVTFIGFTCGRIHQAALDRSTIGKYADWCRAQGGLMTRIEERGGVTYCSYKLELRR